MYLYEDSLFDQVGRLRPRDGGSGTDLNSNGSESRGNDVEEDGRGLPVRDENSLFDAREVELRQTAKVQQIGQRGPGPVRLEGRSARLELLSSGRFE